MPNKRGPQSDLFVNKCSCCAAELRVTRYAVYSVFLRFSTNGTVINMSKLVKKQTYMLQNGDVIYFVYRKSEPEQSE